MITARDRPPEEAAEDTSFARGLRVFLTIADRGEIRADELSLLLETPLSTVYRYLRTLTEFGFIERGEGGYRLGARLHVGGGSTVSAEELIRVADPVLAGLAEITGETALISRRIGLAAVCLAQRPSPQALRVAVEPGTASPLDVGAIALVLLAFAPPAIQEEALGAIDNLDAVRHDLATIAAEGLAHDEGRSFRGTVALAVPILLDDGIVAAIGLMAPSGRASGPWRARAIRALADGAAEIETALRAPGPA